MAEPNLSPATLYHQLIKYLKRSLQGDNYASEMVLRITQTADKIDSSIYEDALLDVANSLSDIDNEYLGQSVNGLIRAAYTDFTELDTFFELYNPPINKNNNYTFNDFCTSYGHRPEDIVLFPISGYSMINAGINDGDTAVVNVAAKPQKGDIAAVHINNKYFIKRIGESGGNIVLISENPEFPPYKVKPDDRLKFIGVVTNIIKKMTK